MTEYKNKMKIQGNLALLQTVSLSHRTGKAFANKIDTEQTTV